MVQNTFSVEQEVDFYINQNKVMVFSKSYCPHCTATKELLREKGGVAWKSMELDTKSDG